MDPNYQEATKAVNRIKSLYPNVNENETPLPRSWSSKDKCTSIGLTQNLRVHYKGTGKSHNDAASVRKNHPMPAACGLYYFEVKIISKGRGSYMGIGLTFNSFKMNCLPGWDKQSYGYHGDDGHSFMYDEQSADERRFKEELNCSWCAENIKEGRENKDIAWLERRRSSATLNS